MRRTTTGAARGIDARPTGPVRFRDRVLDIPIAEHLCGLERLPDSGFRFFAVPVKVRAFGTFPVRAFAVVREGGDRPDAGPAGRG